MLSSFSHVPILANWPVTVSVCPGSGDTGLKEIPFPSGNGAKSSKRCETSVSPYSMSRYPSPSRSAKAGADHTRCGIESGSSHPSETSLSNPVSPSKTKIRRPNATTISGSPSPSISIQTGGETAISSLSFPDPPLFMTLFHTSEGGSSVKSWQPTIPSLSNVTEDAEYQVAQHKRSCTPSSSRSIGRGAASA